MILKELQQPEGTYVAVKLDDEANNDIMNFIKANNIPNPTSKDDIHITIIYSRKYLPEFEPLGTIRETARGQQFDIFKSSHTGNAKSTNCLVLKLNSRFLSNRFTEIMNEHNATHDFDEYSPHITFSYDFGDRDVSDLPNFKKDIKITKEWSKDINQCY